MAAAQVLRDASVAALDVDLLRANDELLGECIVRQEFEPALILAMTAWHVTQAVRGGDDEHVLGRAATVMLVAKKLGDTGHAARMAEYIVRGWRTLVPPRHPELVQAVNEAWQLAAEMGDGERALELYRELATSTGPGAPDPVADTWLRAQAHSLAGQLALQLGSGDDAEEHWRRGEEHARRLPAEFGRPLRITVLTYAGHLRQVSGDLAGAAERLVRAHGLVREQLAAVDASAQSDEHADPDMVANELFNLGVRQVAAPISGRPSASCSSRWIYTSPPATGVGSPVPCTCWGRCTTAWGTLRKLSAITSTR